MASIAIGNILRTRFYVGRRYFCQSSLLSRSIILGIESSCDDTACAIVDTNRQILGECVSSQHEAVSRFGGIMPIIVQDFHQQNIDTVVKNTLENAAMTVENIDAIAVTIQPGLALSLLVGLNYAKELSKQYKKSIIPIHHMEAHALVARLVHPENLSYPYLTFLISGGHCLLAVVYSVRKFVLLGKSIDEAPGEAFDKMARRLKIWNMPEYRCISGGAAIEDAARRGNFSAYTFPEPLLSQLNCNFSFAGLKSHLMRFIAAQEQIHGTVGDEVLPNLTDICASFQFTIAQHLCRRLQRAMEFIDRNEMLPKNDRKLVVSGGVACNSYLLSAFRIVCQELGYTLVSPPPKYCTDNGVMIAWNGVEKYSENIDIISHDQVDKIRVEPKYCTISNELKESNDLLEMSRITPSGKETVYFNDYSCPLGEDATKRLSKAAVKCQWIKLKNLLHDHESDDCKEQKSTVQRSE